LVTPWYGSGKSEQTVSFRRASTGKIILAVKEGAAELAAVSDLKIIAVLPEDRQAKL
jgi:hypothetical protein